MNRAGGRSFFVFYVLATVLVASIAGAVWYAWEGKQKREAEETKARAATVESGPSVPVAEAMRGSGVRRVALVGEALPDKSTTLYAKVSGYLTRIAVDVGDRVTKGQFIATIQSPEIDQQIATLEASLENKRRLLARTRELAGQGFFSQQALDNAETDVRVAESQLAELRTQGGYRVLRAPFSGVVTARYADVGALVQNAATNQTSALPVVTISDTSTLKVSVYVEQAEAPSVQPGLEVEITDASNPLRKVKGKVSRVSGELDLRTRTLLAEVDFDNRKGEFVAGSFVNVGLMIPAVSYVEAPASALLSRDRKNMVAVLTADNRVQLRPVEIAGTDGKVVRIASGLEVGERVALNLPPTVTDGGRVNPAWPPGTAAAGSGLTPSTPGATSAPGSPKRSAQPASSAR